MAFGDGQNDATMLKLAGESYAWRKVLPKPLQPLNSAAAA